MTATDSTGQQVEVFALPRWFIYLLSALSTLFIAIFVPWATWVTATLLTISVRMDLGDKLDARVSVVERAFQEHVADPNLHHSAQRELKARLDAAERRLDLLERPKP